MSDTIHNYLQLSRLYDLQTRDDLANYLDIAPANLRYFLYGKKINEDYIDIKTPKYNGDFRNVSIPNHQIKTIQTKLLNRLEFEYSPKKCVYGFTKGKSFISNAALHVRKAWILNIDLKDYFNQIHFGRVRGMFMSKPYCVGEEAATTIAQIVCYKGSLPQGAPTSPIISNMVASSLDTKLIAFAKKHRLLYTRYADDITISSNYNNIPKSVGIVSNNTFELGSELAKIFDDCDFSINYSKIHFSTPNHRQEVTGLVVNNRVNIKREQLRKIRIMLYTAEKFGLYESAKKYIITHKTIYQEQYKLISKSNHNKQKIEEWYRLVLIGKINYVKLVRGGTDAFYNQFANYYNRIAGTNYFAAKSIHSRTDISYLLRNCTFVVYSYNHLGEVEYQGSAFLLRNWGILTNAHNLPENWFSLKIYDSNQNLFKKVCNSINDVLINRDMDYAFIPCNKDMGWNLCETPQYETNTKVTKIGFPKYQDGDTPNIQRNCEITAHKQDKGGYYTLKGSIFHGDSGGIIINTNNEAIGIIRVGSDAFVQSPDDCPPGFIPIDRVVNDIKSKQKQTS